MKTVYKVLGSGALAIAFAFSASTTSFAQDNPEKEKLYNDFVACYKETDPVKKDACYAIAKQYLDKFGTIQDEYTAFVQKRYDTYSKDKAKGALFTRFNTATKSVETVNPDEAFASGREIYSQNPDLIDVPIVLASIGFDNAVAKTPNDKYNGDTINYAKTVIQQLESGKTSTNYGANAYVYKNTAFPDTKSNTLGWMNYTIGYIMYNRQNMKKEALPYLYKATQFNSGTKANPQIYQLIGNFYVDEFIRLDKERTDKIAAAGNADTDETKALLALQKGYADRAVEAFARAHKVASSDPKDKAYKDSLLNRVKELYGIRFDNNMTGFDAYLASVSNRPLTDPTTAVVPVVEAAPATTSTNTPAGATSMTNTSVAPASTARTTGGTSTAVNGSATTPAVKPAATTTTKKPAAKTPVKKKGTR